MAVESAEDLAGFFDPDEFGEPMVARMAGGDVAFDGIFTDGHVQGQPGSTAPISGKEPRIITRRGPVADLLQNDVIVRADASEWQVNDVQYKGDLLIIYLHEHW